MKKILLLLTIAGILYLTGYPQSFSLSWSGGDISDKSEINVLEEPPIELVTLYVYVKNNSAETKSVKVKRVEKELLPNCINYFCWGACYPPNVNESSVARDIGPGLVDSNGFSGDYDASMCEVMGVSKIWYVFFDERNSNDSVSVLVNYITGHAGVADNIKKMIELSEAYPNPAGDYTSFNYSLPSEIRNAAVVIRNILGSKIREIPITNMQGKLFIETSDMKEGIYIYSLVANNQTILSRKLVVNR